jgi:hypothetical protein
MGYETDPAGIGVPKTYGPRDIGDVNGIIKTEGGTNEIVYQITHGTSEGADATDQRYVVTLPVNYRVTEIYAVITEAFASSSTADFSIGGGAGMTTDVNLTTLGNTNYVLTGLANTTSTTSKDIVVILNANALASATGEVKLVVKYEAL